MGASNFLHAEVFLLLGFELLSGFDVGLQICIAQGINDGVSASFWGLICMRGSGETEVGVGKMDERYTCLKFLIVVR